MYTYTHAYPFKKFVRFLDHVWLQKTVYLCRIASILCANKWLRSALILTSTRQVIRAYLTIHKDIPLLVPYLQTGTIFFTHDVNMSQRRITEIREKNRGVLDPVLVLDIFIKL